MSKKSKSQQLAEFRFSIIGNLLSSPPARGSKKKEFKNLAEKQWIHPITKDPVSYHWHTIEQWYYEANRASLNPLSVLHPKERSDKGESRVLTEEVKAIILERYAQYKSWSFQLHQDNLVIDLNNKKIKPIPSYSTVRRFLKSKGKFKIKDHPSQDREGYQKSLLLQNEREIRSYENDNTNGLWHLDYHHASRKVITSSGAIVRPNVLAIIDDHSRLVCHIQWYLGESADELIHGFKQALQKRDLPRSLMSDNGAAMTSSEFTEGLLRLGIEHKTTLPYSPYQNGKQEVFWAQLEGRLMSMLKNKEIITLKELNDLTLAWVEIEYNKSNHSEINSTPLNRFLNDNDVSRECPSLDYLTKVFRREVTRRIRRSDSTISLEGKRFEIPYQYKHLGVIRIHYAKWDLSFVHMVDDKGVILSQIVPVDKSKNASAIRKSIFTDDKKVVVKDQSYPPLLQDIVDQQAKTAIAPAYIPRDN